MEQPSNNENKSFFTNFSKKVAEKQDELDEIEKEKKPITDVDIDDNRKNKDFLTITFSGFKRTDVIKSFLESLIFSKIESANYWCAELVCSRYYDHIWNIFIEFYCKYINIANIKVSVYLEQKHRQYDQIKISQKEPFNDLRNNINIRKIYSEVIFILCESPKRTPINYVKINKEEDFKIESLKLHFKAPSTEYIDPIYYEKDPEELFISMNELSYHLFNNNTLMVYFWIEWILGFETLKINKGITYECVPRDFVELEDKYKSEIVWIMWDIFLSKLESINNKILDKVFDSILYLFYINYTKSCYRKRKYILYLISNILCNIDSISFEQSILKENKEEQMMYIIDNINLIYTQIKKYEQKYSLFTI